MFGEGLQSRQSPAAMEGSVNLGSAADRGTPDSPVPLRPTARRPLNLSKKRRVDIKPSESRKDEDIKRVRTNSEDARRSISDLLPAKADVLVVDEVNNSNLCTVQKGDTTGRVEGVDGGGGIVAQQSSAPEAVLVSDDDDSDVIEISSPEAMPLSPSTTTTATWTTAATTSLAGSSLPEDDSEELHWSQHSRSLLSDDDDDDPSWTFKPGHDYEAESDMDLCSSSTPSPVHVSVQEATGTAEPAFAFPEQTETVDSPSTADFKLAFALLQQDAEHLEHATVRSFAMTSTDQPPQASQGSPGLSSAPSSDELLARQLQREEEEAQRKRLQDDARAALSRSTSQGPNRPRTRPPSRVSQLRRPAQSAWGELPPRRRQPRRSARRVMPSAYDNPMSSVSPSSMQAILAALSPAARQGILHGGMSHGHPMHFLPPPIFADQPEIGDSYEELLALDDTIERPGVSKELLQLSTIVQTVKTQAEAEQFGKCVICLGEVEVDEEVRRLPCMCTFHAGCIDQFLKDHVTCPICRRDIRNTEPS